MACEIGSYFQAPLEIGAGMACAAEKSEELGKDIRLVCSWYPSLYSGHSWLGLSGRSCRVEEVNVEPDENCEDRVYINSPFFNNIDDAYKCIDAKLGRTGEYLELKCIPVFSFGNSRELYSQFCSLISGKASQ